MRPPLLLLSRPTVEPDHQLPPGQTVEDLRDLRGRGEPVQPVAALLELADRLRSAQHQHPEQRKLFHRERERLVEEMAVLERAAAGTTGEPGPAAVREAVERSLDLALLVDDDRFTIRRLVAGEPERVQGQRIRVGWR